MKDEEIAEESLINYRKEPKWAGKMFMQDENTCYKDGFLAGLKEGRQQWHDLRKDPNDLPKRNNELTDKSDVIITDKGIAHYNFRKQKWYVHNFECDMSFSECVIAWCEIPTFDKE